MSEAQMRRISYLRSIVKDRDAEIERLRAALREIIDFHTWEDISNEECMRDIARAVLEGTNDD